MAIVQEEEIREVVDETTGLIRQVQTTRIGLHDGEGGLYVAEQTRDVSARVMVSLSAINTFICKNN